MNLAPFVYPDLLPENVFGHRHKVECLRASMDGLRAPQRPHLRVLDAGCGSGYAVTRFLPRRGDRVVGIDLYAPSIDYGQRNFGGEELRFVCADLATLPYSEGQYDVVVLADVLEHIDDPLAVLSAAAARLVPGGLLLASVPNGRGPFEIESALSRVPVLGPVLLRLTDLSVAVLNKFIMKGGMESNDGLDPGRSALQRGFRACTVLFTTRNDQSDPWRGVGGGGIKEFVFSCRTLYQLPSVAIAGLLQMECAFRESFAALAGECLVFRMQEDRGQGLMS